MNILFRFLTLLLLISPSFAETIHLKDGRSLSGKVVRNQKTVTIVTEEGKLYQVKNSDLKPTQNKTEKATDKESDKMSNPVIRITTSKGDMEFELFEDQVPNTVANIISLAEKGFYKGMSFHRIIDGFMAQGGCPNSKDGASGMPGTGGPGYTFDCEPVKELKHVGAGILSMANAGRNTNGSQFFICFVDCPWLDGKHTVFGKIIKGEEVLEKLEAVGSRSGKTKEKVTFDIEVVSKRDHDYTVKTN